MVSEMPKIEPPRFNTNPQTTDGATSRSSTVVWKPEVVSTFAPNTQPRFKTTSFPTTLPPTTTKVIPSSTTALKNKHPTNPPPLIQQNIQQNFQQQWHQTSPSHFIQTNPPFVKQSNTGFTQHPPPQRPTFVETTILPPHAPPASPPLFHSNSQQHTFLLQNNNAAIPAQPQPQRPVERIVPLQPIAQQPHFRIPTLPPKLPLPDANRQFAQPTFNQAAFEKALPPSPEVVKSEYQPPNPPIRTDFNPYIPPPPQTREGYSPPAQPTVHRPLNPQDQWPANTRKPAGGSYGMEEISPTRESNHINIQPINPAPEVPHVQHHWPVTTPQPSTTLHAVEENKAENLVPIFAASSHPPQQIPTTTPTLTRLPIKHIAPVAPPRIIQPSQQENEYSNGQETVETPVASQKSPQSNTETIRTEEKPKTAKPLAPAAPSPVPPNVPDQYNGETVESVAPSNKQPSLINEQINHEYASGPEKSKPTAPIESQPQPSSKPINHEYSTGPEIEKHPPVSPVEKSKPAPEIITAPKAPSISSPTTVAAAAPQGSNSGGYEEPTTKFPTLKPEVSTSDTPTNSVEAQKPAETKYETSETPEESLVVLDKVSAEAGPKTGETTPSHINEQRLPQTYEISDITASSTSAPVQETENNAETKSSQKAEVKPTANVNEYRVFGEKSNTQKAIEPPLKIPQTTPPKIQEEKNNLGKIQPSIESKNIRLQVIDGGSDRSVGRKPITLPEGLVNIPINKEMENILIKEGIVSQQSGNGGKDKSEGEIIVNGRGEGITSGFVESGSAKNVKVEFSTSEPAQNENIVQVVEFVKQSGNTGANRVQLPKITESLKEFETKMKIETFTPPTPPMAPITMATTTSRLSFEKKHENIQISNLPVNPTILSSTNSPTVSTIIQTETTVEEFVTVPTTRKLIRIQPIHPTIVETKTKEITSQPTTSETILPAEKKEEKILSPIITGDVEEHHSHGMLEEVIIAKPEETVEKPKLIAAETVENQSVKPILEQTTENLSPEASITSTTTPVQNIGPQDVKITVPVQISEPHETKQASGAPVKIVKESIEIVQVPNVNIDALNKPAENSQTYQHSSNIFQSTHGVKTSQQGEIHISEPEIQRVPTRPIASVQPKETPSPTIIYQSFNKTVKFNEDKAEESHTEYKKVQTSSHSTSNQQEINIEREEIIQTVTSEM
uniref:Uncharacterized protein n=1 Tax=Panagrolaimus sp. PS1159 TaxID=55785 RepID=A0AC35ETU5_9BILA